MSTISRTLRNLRKVGIKDYAHQMMYIGDTKAGTLIATDRYGNKYFENLQDELPRMITLPDPLFLKKLVSDSNLVRTRWVDYKDPEYSAYVFCTLPAFAGTLGG